MRLCRTSCSWPRSSSAPSASKRGRPRRPESESQPPPARHGRPHIQHIQHWSHQGGARAPSWRGPAPPRPSCTTSACSESSAASCTTLRGSTSTTSSSTSAAAPRCRGPRGRRTRPCGPAPCRSSSAAGWRSRRSYGRCSRRPSCISSRPASGTAPRWRRGATWARWTPARSSKRWGGGPHACQHACQPAAACVQSSGGGPRRRAPPWEQRPP
jgi:hypothetical protein